LCIKLYLEDLKIWLTFSFCDEFAWAAMSEKGRKQSLSSSTLPRHGRPCGDHPRLATLMAGETSEGGGRLEPDSKVHAGFQCLAMRRVSMRMLAM
jgi:hypothetical protein